MYKKNNKLVFNRLIGEIGGIFLEKTIRKYAGDHRSQHFDTKSHIYSLLYLNIKDCKSLRAAKTEISTNVILAALKLVPHLKLDNERAGIKVSTLFNGEFHERINVVKAQVNDRKCVDDMFIDKNSLYMFDRGYYNYH